MLYAILCYNCEVAVGAWSRQKEEEVLARRRLIQDKLHAQGKLGPVARLMPTTAATTVRGGSDAVVIDGPFAESKEQLLGFYVVDCETLEHAIEIARGLVHESGALEIRPVRWFNAGALT